MDLVDKVAKLNNDDLMLLLAVLKAKPGTETEIYFARRKQNGNSGSSSNTDKRNASNAFGYGR